MKRPTIRVDNSNKTYKLDIAFIKRLISKILKSIKGPQRYIELEVIFLDDASIKILNKIYKNRNVPTDVLSFRLSMDGFRPKRLVYELFISLDTAFKNAKRFKTSFESEITLYIIHGILHNYGYNDLTSSNKIKMSRKENHILNKLCESEDLSKVLMPR